MSAEQRIEQIRVKVERAKEHFQTLESEVRTYLTSNPYAVGAKRDPTSRRLIYFLSGIHPPPLKISTILGDTIHNLRGALDYLAYQLVWIGTGSLPAHHVYFPISDNVTKYIDQRKKQLKGAHTQAIAEIDALKPYQGGNDTLWRLHKLDIVDKHRTLITAGSAYQSVNIGPVMLRHMQQSFTKFSEIPLLDLFIRPEDRMFPLKVGNELFIDQPDAVIDEHIQFKFELAFAEKDVVEGEPILETIQPMVALVDEIVTRFEPLLV